MAAPIPIVFNEALNLTAVGVASESIKFGSCSMESDKFITICDSSSGSPQIIIVDTSQSNAVKKRPIKAEAAIMNPRTEVLALRSGTTLQIFNLELQVSRPTRCRHLCCYCRSATSVAPMSVTPAFFTPSLRLPQARMKSTTMTEAVVFWRWTSVNNIVLVTATAVFNWSIEGESAPTKVFDRHQSLAEGVQIINYQVNGSR